MLLDDLATPALLVERSRLRDNLARMQQTADDGGAALRPHTKTHKSVAIARMQREQGARGITVAKPSEAEVFVDAGFDDVRIAYAVVGPHRHAQVHRLMERARLSFCVDTVAGAEQASAFYAAHDTTADVLMEVDVGHGRCGVPWDDARGTVALAERITALPGLQLCGILTHAGQAYQGPRADETPEEALRRVAHDEHHRMLAVACRLREAGVAGVAPGAFEISVGSTPTMAGFEPAERDGFRLTEVRPGNYVFYDAMQVGLGAAGWTDCALTALATVVSGRRDADGTERLYLDAGKKVLTSDTSRHAAGHGQLLYNAVHMRVMPHARISNLSEEHGWVEVPGGATFDVGDRVRCVPVHACTAVATQDRLVLVDGEEVVGELEVDARGCVQ